MPITPEGLARWASQQQVDDVEVLGGEHWIPPQLHPWQSLRAWLARHDGKEVRLYREGSLLRRVTIEVKPERVGVKLKTPTYEYEHNEEKENTMDMSALIQLATQIGELHAGMRDVRDTLRALGDAVRELRESSAGGGGPEEILAQLGGVQGVLELLRTQGAGGQKNG